MPTRTRGLPALLVAVLLCASAAVSQNTVRTHTGGADNDNLGTAVSGGVYASADSIPDLAIGSPGHDGGAGAGQGRIDVFDGATGTSLFSVVGAAAGDNFGAAVGLGGDVDNDGSNDVAVGAPLANPGLGLEQGQVTIYSGATGLAIWTLDGSTAGDRFGASVAIIGDIDGDGRSEFAVGAPLFDGTAGADCGRVTIHSGATGNALFTLEGTGAGALYGSSVAGLGDTDGDGTNDVGVGAPSFDGTAGVDSGRIAIISGSTGLEIRSVEGGTAGEALGTSVGAVGDVDNDTYNDLGAGAPLFDGVAGLDTGLVIVVSGRDGSTLMSVEGTAANTELGTSVSGGGDVDLDGFDDVVAGAPRFDGAAGADSGRVVVLSGADGSELFDLEGSAAGDQEGSAVAGIGDIVANNRMEIASGAPQRAGGGTARGEVTVLGGSANAGSQVTAYGSGSQPKASVLCDADADGDLDVITVENGTVSILWNGDQTGATPVANLGQTTRTDITLSAGANGVSIAAGNLDADAACEIAVGRSDGTVDIIDGSGSGAAVTYTLTAASPFTVDASGTPGAIQGVAIYGAGATGSIVCAGVGSFATSGFIDRITDPMGTPALGGQLVTGGAFQAVVVGDIDGDATNDIIAANNSTGVSGGVHVLDGATSFTPASGSPFAAGASPIDITLMDLDGDGTDDDVAIASLDFSGGGVRILPDYVAGAGFGVTHDPGLTLARAVAAGNFDGVAGDDLAALDGIGDLIRLEGWTGTAFATQTTTATTDGAAVQVATGQLTRGSTPDLCDTDEVVTAHLSTDLVNVWRLRQTFTVTPVANTGCPFAAPTVFVSFSGDPVIGATGITIDMTGASPLAMAILVVTVNTPLGSMPTVDTTSGCGVASSAGAVVQFLTFTDALGSASIPSGIPDDPCLIGEEFLLQWGILDGGPYLGVYTVSDAIVVAIGEN